MLFPLMMALLFVTPLFGYYWLWSRHVTPLQSVPSVLWTVVCLILGYILLTTIVWSSIANMKPPYPPHLILDWILMFLWGIAGPISLGIYLHFARKVPQQKAKSSRQSHLLSICLILFANLAPMITISAQTSRCYFLSLSNAEPLVLALETYHNVHDSYPTNLYELVPDYIDFLPRPACTAPEYADCNIIWEDEYLPNWFDGSGTFELYLISWYIGSEWYRCSMNAIS